MLVHQEQQHRINCTEVMKLVIPYRLPVLQQQHQWKCVWSGSCEKYVGGTIAESLAALFIGYRTNTWNAT